MMTLKWMFYQLGSSCNGNWDTTTKLLYFLNLVDFFFVDNEYFEIHICQFAAGEKRYFVNQN